jgi:hypothetical protein
VKYTGLRLAAPSLVLFGLRNARRVLTQFIIWCLDAAFSHQRTGYMSISRTSEELGLLLLYRSCWCDRETGTRLTSSNEVVLPRCIVLPSRQSPLHVKADYNLRSQSYASHRVRPFSKYSPRSFISTISRRSRFGRICSGRGTRRVLSQEQVSPSASTTLR